MHSEIAICSRSFPIVRRCQGLNCTERVANGSSQRVPQVGHHLSQPDQIHTLHLVSRPAWRPVVFMARTTPLANVHAAAPWSWNPRTRLGSQNTRTDYQSHPWLETWKQLYPPTVPSGVTLSLQMGENASVHCISWSDHLPVLTPLYTCVCEHMLAV